MSINNDNWAQLRSLICKSLDGTLVDQERLLLRKIIAEDAKAKEHYLDVVMVHGLLHHISGNLSNLQQTSVDKTLALIANENEIQTVDEIEAETHEAFIKIIEDDLNSVEDKSGLTQEDTLNILDIELKHYPKKRMPLSKKVYYGSIFKIAAVVIFSISAIWLDQQLWKTEVFPEPIREPIANVKTMQGKFVIERDGWQFSVNAGDVLYGDTYEVAKDGFASIEFINGAQVLIEGPTRFTMGGMQELYLHWGKAYCKVPPQAIGFTIGTSGARVVDYGTEFGVQAYGNGVAEVHVSDGEVKVASIEGKHAVSVLQGEAKQVSITGTITDTPFSRDHFVSLNEYAVRLKGNAGSDYHRWKAYSHELRRDPSLVAYYTFEKDESDLGLLHNEANETLGGLDGVLGTMISDETLPQWSQGRWPQKSALAFKRDKRHYVKVAAHPRLAINGDITIATWVKLEGNQSGGHLISCRTQENANYQIATRLPSEQTRKLQFLRYEKSDGSKTKYSKYFPVVRAKVWHHLVITHNNNMIQYYVNGELIDKIVHRFKGSAVPAELYIGLAEYRGQKDDDAFEGVVGEIAIFDRIISQSEIVQMYQSGKL